MGDSAVVDGRWRPLAPVMALREAVVAGLRDSYRGEGVVEVRPPLLVGVTGACENIDTLLAVRGAEDGGLGHPTDGQRGSGSFLSQTGQLALESVLAGSDACWCHTVSFRNDEPSPRHLREFELIEEELSVDSARGLSDIQLSAPRMLDGLLERIEEVVRVAFEAAIDSGAAEGMGVGTEHIRAALGAAFPRVTYDDALALANVERGKRGERLLTWGEDLSPPDEAAIVRASSTERGVLLPTFVTLFPSEIKFFNMKLDPREPRRVLSADLLMPEAGETVGAAVREDDYDTLVDRLVSSPMFAALEARETAPREAFEPYLELIRRKATPPHAGYGIGVDRLLQFIAKATDIRETSLAYRLTDGG